MISIESLRVAISKAIRAELDSSMAEQLAKNPVEEFSARCRSHPACLWEMDHSGNVLSVKITLGEKL